MASRITARVTRCYVSWGRYCNACVCDVGCCREQGLRRLLVRRKGAARSRRLGSMTSHGPPYPARSGMTGMQGAMRFRFWERGMRRTYGRHPIQRLEARGASLISRLRALLRWPLHGVVPCALLGRDDCCTCTSYLVAAILVPGPLSGLQQAMLTRAPKGKRQWWQAVNDRTWASAEQG